MAYMEVAAANEKQRLIAQQCIALNQRMQFDTKCFKILHSKARSRKTSLCEAEFGATRLNLLACLV
eukprot:1143481-Pelagomonas_calceolata.AAC.5